MNTARVALFAVIALVLPVGCEGGALSSGDVQTAQNDASIDACVEAEGNCGCVIEETLHYVPGQVTPVATQVIVCPDK